MVAVGYRIGADERRGSLADGAHADLYYQDQKTIKSAEVSSIHSL